MIVGYIGSIGTGKTMNAARDAIELAKRRKAPDGKGALLVSNIRLRSHGLRGIEQLSVGHDGLDLDALRALITKAQECEVCTLRDEFGDLRHGGKGCERYGLVILLDEVGVLMPARFWADFPIDLIFELSQSRKSGVDFLYTAQDVEQVDAILRRLTQYVWMVKAFPVSSIERAEKGKRPWFFMLSKWKPKHIETQHRAPLGRTFRRYSRRWESVYSTLELVRPPERMRQRSKRSSGFA